MAHSGPGFTGKQVWQRLMEGNMRFVQGLFQGRNLLDLRRTLAQGQQPEAAVLCCSDSRVPAEIIFDQSLGDLFVVRTAGLVLDPTSIGSLEYAVAHLHVRRFPVGDLPAGDEELARWLYLRFQEKDRLLDHFYRHGRFPEGPLPPTA